MKLYNKYKNLIKKLGEIKTAWFTSFNLSPFFVETYIIPPIVGYNTKPIRHDEFEQIQQIINESEIDIRFFCDRRYIELSETKKTCVPFYLLDINETKGLYRNGCFHAKVILLINKDHRAFLITGSANLTISGWAHNREAIVIKEIKDNKNKLEVIKFFKACFKIQNEIFPKIKINTNKENDNWEFISSFSKDPFLDKLFPSEEMYDNCTIFSPYFSSNLNSLLDDYILTRAQKCLIVPDITSANQIRLENNKQNSRIINNKKVKFGKVAYSNSNEAKINMTHAKLWITDNKIAIGSWNLSEAALNVGNNNYNIEAGIIYKTSEAGKIEQEIKPLKIDDLFMTKDELKDEDENTINNIDFDITVKFDWEIEKYIINISKELEQKKYILLLPDCKDFYIEQNIFTKEIDKVDRLLVNKIFSIKYNSKIIYTGIILEEKNNFRPVWKFNNINDIFYSFIQEKFNNSSDKLVLRALSHLSELIIDDNINFIELRNDTLTYFDLFRAFKNINNRIIIISNMKSKRLIELNYLIKVYPNSLLALNENIKILLEEKNEEYVLKWILCKEYNELILHILSKFELGTELKKYLENLIFKSEIKIKKVNAKWRNFIKREYYSNFKVKVASHE